MALRGISPKTSAERLRFLRRPGLTPFTPHSTGSGSGRFEERRGPGPGARDFVKARGSPNHPRRWTREICRDGEPLPARLREEGFATDYTATAAGNVALRYFLAGARREEGKP
jgi:hypothetical protein